MIMKKPTLLSFLLLSFISCFAQNIFLTKYAEESNLKGQVASTDFVIKYSGECYYDSVGQRMRPKNEKPAGGKLNLDYMQSLKGRLTFNDKETFDLLAVKKADQDGNIGSMTYYDARDMHGNDWGIVIVCFFKAEDAMMLAIKRCEIYIFNKDGNGAYFDCYNKQYYDV
jgi:hypothetical protein